MALLHQVKEAVILSLKEWRKPPKSTNCSIIAVLKPVGCKVSSPIPALCGPPPTSISSLHPTSQCFIGCHQLAPLPPWAVISSFHCSISLSHPLPGYTHDSTHLSSPVLHIISSHYNCHQTCS